MIIIDSLVSVYTDVSKHSQLVRAWGTYCHNKEIRRKALIIDYSNIRETSRWQCEKRGRPFLVKSAYDLRIVTSSKTLDGAIKLASKLLTSQVQ